MATKDLTETNFMQTVQDEGIVLVDFWASWCGPCKAFAPVYEKSAAKHPDITFGKLNTEDEASVAAAFQIRAIPTLMIFRDGIPIFSQAGMLPAAALEDLIRQARDLDMDEVRKQVHKLHEAQGHSTN